MKEEIYANFKYCTGIGKRLAIFARPVGEKETELFILTCSKRDNFSRKRAREIYSNWVDFGEARYYTTYFIGFEDSEFKRGLKKHICHPIIQKIPFKLSHHEVNEYVRELGYKTFYPKSTVIGDLKEFFDALNEQGYFVDFDLNNLQWKR
jgi:hypothetical protein